MATVDDFDRYDLAATELASMVASAEGVKLVHNLTDRGLIPFRREGRSRLYSFASALVCDTMIRARGAGLPLSEGAKLAEVVTQRAKELLSDPWSHIDAGIGRKWLVYAFDRETDALHLAHGLVERSTPIEDLEVTLLSGWPSDVTSLFPIDRVIWECADNYDRAKKLAADNEEIQA